MELINLSDFSYVAEFEVGNPPQKLRGLFDTGSTNMWILNESVDIYNKNIKVPKKRSYNDQESKTAHKTNQTAHINFGSGKLSGTFMTDDINFAGIQIKQQKFGNVEQQSSIFTGNNFEAIIGLAYPVLAEKGVIPAFNSMIQQNVLQSNMFAFYLTNKEAELMGLHSDLTFGYYDKSKFKGSLDWHPVLFKYMYGVKLDDIKIGGKPLNICKSKPKRCLITFDSGTSFMSVPTWAEKVLVD